MSSKYKPAWHLSGPTPYDVQIEGMRRVRGKKRYGWYLEQGLGKTALQLNDYVENLSDYDTVFVVCPNSFKKDWTLAPAEWGLPDITTSLWPNEEFRTGTSSRPHFNVLNFEAIRSSGYNVVADIMKRRPSAIVVDESSAIKNFKSQTARAVLDLCKRTDVVRLLNGTPLTQNVMDLFPQLKALGELNGVNPFSFRNRYATMGGWMGKQITGIKNEVELHEIQSRCSFRALKEDWSDLPEKIPVPMRLEMTNKQLRHYREMLQDFYTMVGTTEFTANMVLSQNEKLRQVTSGLLMGEGHVELIEEPKNNPKVKAALELMESGSGKMIVVHFYTKMGEILFNEFKRVGLNPAYLRGGMSPDEIVEQKDFFNKNNASRILVAQITASSMSHTLLAGEGDDRCHKMFYHDLTWNLRDKLQMDDRIHRGAQDKVCLYYEPVMSPICEAQFKALRSKRDIATAIVDAVRALKGTI